MSTRNIKLDPLGEPVLIADEGRKYFTADSVGGWFGWSTQADGPWHREQVLTGIDLPAVPMYVKSLGQKTVLTVTIYDS